VWCDSSRSPTKADVLTIVLAEHPTINYHAENRNKKEEDNGGRVAEDTTRAAALSTSEPSQCEYHLAGITLWRAGYQSRTMPHPVSLLLYDGKRPDPTRLMNESSGHS
jgi:hypothetical protein